MRKLLFIIPLLIFIISCNTHERIIEIPVETVHIEYRTNTVTDSVYMKDSVDRYMIGDTLYIYKERTKYKYFTNTDTIIKIDSIPKIIKVETVKEVEVNHIKWYQKTLMWIGGVMSLIAAIYLICKIKLIWWK